MKLKLLEIMLGKVNEKAKNKRIKEINNIIR